MEPTCDSLVHVNSSLEHIPNCSEPDSPDLNDNRPSILITFQNSASYYTSYMESGGMRSAATRRKNSDVVLPQQQHQKDHPIVIMKDYPTPGPVSVAVNNCKQNHDRGFKPFSGPPTPPKPEGPPGPPGPPMPNLPSSRRGSINPNTLELPKSRRGSMTPSVNSKNRSPSTRTRSLVPNTHTSTSPGQYVSSTLPRGPKTRLPRNSHSMPTLTDILASDSLEQLQVAPSPRPSVCSSAAAYSQMERRPLMADPRQLADMEDDWSPPPQPKPNWLSINMDEDKRKNATQSVYVAEIWPSLVCILTAVLMTLIVYILVSYYYYIPHPNTRDILAPSPHRPTAHPPPPTPFPYHYPYMPPPYDRFPPYPYPQQPPEH